MDTLKEVIEAKLKIKLEDMANYQTDNLNEFDATIIERARLLDHEYEAEYYLGLFVTDENSHYLKGFVRSVVSNKEDHRTWGKGVVIVRETSYITILTEERSTLFGRSDDQLNKILPNDLDGWKQQSDLGGIFAFYLPDADYKFNCPKDYTLIQINPDQLQDVSPEKVKVQYRRWLASKLAAYLKYFNQLNENANTKVLEEITPKETWTEDALIALDGLLKELQLDTKNDKCVPGFYGPDDFYC